MDLRISRPWKYEGIGTMCGPNPIDPYMPRDTYVDVFVKGLCSHTTATEPPVVVPCFAMFALYQMLWP